MEVLQNIDQWIFQKMNGEWTTSFFDFVLPWFRNKYLWVPLYVFLIAQIILKFKKKAYIIITTAFCLILLTDQLTASLIKPTVQRLRPCHNEALMENLRLLAPCRSSFSFPSAHASNHFAVAGFFSLLFAIKSYRFLYVWAFLISYAQVYVGLHYPGDVTIGAALGLALSFFTYYFLNKNVLNFQSE